MMGVVSCDCVCVFVLDGEQTREGTELHGRSLCPSSWLVRLLLMMAAGSLVVYLVGMTPCLARRKSLFFFFFLILKIIPKVSVRFALVAHEAQLGSHLSHMKHSLVHTCHT